LAQRPLTPGRVEQPVDVAVLEPQSAHGSSGCARACTTLQQHGSQQPEPEGLKILPPEDHELEVFVTATDFFGSCPQVLCTDLNPIIDTRHRHVLAFRSAIRTSLPEMTSAADVKGALFFAARATSCIERSAHL
jgi:hypothetical protein